MKNNYSGKWWQKLIDYGFCYCLAWCLIIFAPIWLPIWLAVKIYKMPPKGEGKYE